MEPQRTAFAQEFLELARREWPWLASAGWAVDRPDAPPDDPAWGFATDAALLGALRDGAAVAPQPQTGWDNRVAWIWLVLASVATVVAGWRLVRAAHVAGWRTWLVCCGRGRDGSSVCGLCSCPRISWPRGRRWCCCCWGRRQCWYGFNHAVRCGWACSCCPSTSTTRKLHFAAGTLFLPPTQAVMLAALPTLILARRDRSTRPSWTLAGFDGLALGWLVLGAAALHVRYWPGYIQGMADLVVTPLLLYALVRRSAPDAQAAPGAAALFAGGVLAALVGLAGWIGGAGTVADGLRRLVGPTFRPIHCALPGAHALLGPGPLVRRGTKHGAARPRPSRHRRRGDARPVLRCC
ncbi:MAG: hypothetical protein R2851_11715 [Caldilineaceae bacterium]